VKSQLPTLGELPDGHSFREAIAALIDSLAAGEFDFGGRRTGIVSVRFDGPTPRGSISVEVRRVARLWYRENANFLYSDKDLSQQRTFTIETLREIARIIGGSGALVNRGKGVIEIGAAIPGKPPGRPNRGQYGKRS
jgi:hypothetical protein